MALLPTKSIARIYLDEVRKGVDSSIVPVFTPDTAIDVGDFGSFEDGQFVRKGNLRGRGVELAIDETEHAGFHYASSHKVQLGPSVMVPNPAGGELVEATLSFSRGKSVAASFQGGRDRFVEDGDAFGELLAGLWARGELRTDRAVVWSVKHAIGGTVVVATAGGAKVKVTADAALLGAAGITLQGLSLGVDFGSQNTGAWTMSKAAQPLVVWARLLRLDHKTAAAIDGFGFEGGADLVARAAALKPVEVSAEEVVAEIEE